MSIFAVLTQATCGFACWEAKEDVCRCSCGGANHGIALRGGTAERTSKIDGVRYKLAGVGTHTDLVKEAGAVNSQIVLNTYWDSGYRAFKISKAGHLDRGAPARVKYATDAQIEKWAELSAYKGINRYKSNAALLWVRVDIEELTANSKTVTPAEKEAADRMANYSPVARAFVWNETLYRVSTADALDWRVVKLTPDFHLELLKTMELHAPEIKTLAAQNFYADSGFEDWRDKRYGKTEKVGLFT